MSGDTLSELLRAVRLRGAVFYHVDGFAPWIAEAPNGREIASAIIPGADHLIEYHVVVRGRCYAAIVGEDSVALGEGDVIMFPQGDAHVMSSAPGMRADHVDKDVYFAPKPPQLPYVVTQRGTVTAPADGDRASVDGATGDGAEGRATIVCGFLGLDARPFNPLIASLPRMLHMRGGAANGGWNERFVAMAVDEANRKRPGGEAVLERLSELMFVDVVRRYLEGMPLEQTGWLAGLRDRYVGRALALLHEKPAHPWSIDELCHRVGLSRSALHERFVALIGHAPMQYLAQWRMQVASQLLTGTTLTMAAVALEAGYESEAAFSRAFKRVVGVPPATWRRQRSPGQSGGIAASDGSPADRAALPPR